MMEATTMAPLSGVMPALLTPLDESGGLDRPGLDRLLDHVLAAPLAGVSPCGSTGEGPLLGRPLRVETVRAVAARLRPGQALVAGTAAPSAAAAREEIDAYAEAGATAALVAPPWYFPLSAGEIGEFYLAVAEDSALPVVLYNIPAMTKVTIPAPVVAELAGHPRVAGVKDSSRDFEYFNAVVAATRSAEFSVLTGTDTMLLASLVAGGAGTIAASVNVVPHLAQGLYEAATAGRLEEASRLQESLTGVVSAARRAGFPRGWKAAAAALGLCSDRTAHPLRPADGAETAALTKELAELGVV
jgi:dihydrodipicolinate synthase/N-acetylneuraminate lyase